MNKLLSADFLESLSKTYTIMADEEHIEIHHTEHVGDGNGHKSIIASISTAWYFENEYQVEQAQEDTWFIKLFSENWLYQFDDIKIINKIVEQLDKL